MSWFTHLQTAQWYFAASALSHVRRIEVFFRKPSWEHKVGMEDLEKCLPHETLYHNFHKCVARSVDELRPWLEGERCVGERVQGRRTPLAPRRACRSIQCSCVHAPDSDRKIWVDVRKKCG